MDTVAAPQQWSTEEERLRAAYAARPPRDPRRYWERWERVFLMHERERRLLGLLKKAGIMPLAEKRILEIGSGTGGVLRELIKWGATPECVTGVDVLPEAIEIARELLPSGVALLCRNAAELPFPDRSFDLVCQFTTFSSIFEPELKQKIASEMRRVLKPDGAILWCDLRLNNPKNQTIRAVGKTELKALFPGYRFRLERISPPAAIVRPLAPRSWILTYLVAQIPCVCTQLIGVATNA